MQEWFKEFEIGRRHLAHLFALYPVDGVNEEKTKGLFEVCRVSLERRLIHGDGHIPALPEEWKSGYIK